MSENIGTVGASGIQAMLDEPNFREMEIPVLPLEQLELLGDFFDPSPSARNQEEGLWEDKGKMLLKIPDLLGGGVDQYTTKFSTFNGFYHIKSGPTGRMNVELTLEGLPDLDTKYVRFCLARVNSAYSQLPVDQVCQLHCLSGDQHVNNILRPIITGPGPIGPTFLKDQGFYPSLVYQVDLSSTGTTIVNHEMYFTCNDSCVNTTQFEQIGGGKQMKHAARNLRLVVTFENWSGEVLARRSALVWPKANICKRDLEKTERRLPQGGAAQAAKRRRENNNNTEDAEAQAAKRRRENINNNTEDAEAAIPAGDVDALGALGTAMANIFNRQPDPTAEMLRVFNVIADQVNPANQ